MRNIGEIYKYLVLDDHPHGYIYAIYRQGEKYDLVTRSKEWFDNAGQASLAAIGHINLLEKGDNHD